MALEYYGQPYKSLYLVYAGLTLLFRVPTWTIRNLFPSWRVHPRWTLYRVLTMKALLTAARTVFRTGLLPSFSGPDPKKLVGTPEGDRAGLVYFDPAPHLIQGSIRRIAEDVNNVALELPTAGYWYGSRGTDGKVGQAAGPDERVVYHLHGGGYVADTGHPSGAMSALDRGFLEFMPDLFPRTFSVEYRLARAPPLPATGAFPSALVDAVYGYNYLVNSVGFKPENILVMGASAGGSLAYMLTRYLTQEQQLHEVVPPARSLSVPGAVCMLSPTAEWVTTHTDANGSFRSFAKSDYVAPFQDGYTARAIMGNLPWAEVQTNTWIAPGSLRLDESAIDGLFTGFPHSIVLAGGVEMTRDCMRTFYARLVAQLGADKARYLEQASAAHIPMALPFFEPERTEGFLAVKAWLEEIRFGPGYS